MTKSLDNFDLFEVQSRAVGLLVEPTEVWSYGEGCECGCKWIVLRQFHIVSHCKTVAQVKKAIAAEGKGLEPLREKHREVQAKAWEAVQLKLI